MTTSIVVRSTDLSVNTHPEIKDYFSSRNLGVNIFIITISFQLFFVQTIFRNFLTIFIMMLTVHCKTVKACNLDLNIVSGVTTKLNHREIQHKPS